MTEAVAGLEAVLPAAATALGVPLGEAGPIELAPARHVIVVLLDGLGAELLARRGGHAPFMRGLGADGLRLTSPFPSTTATSMGTLGTGLLPGAHGLVGLDVLDPQRSVVFSELAWDNAVDPRLWQPETTVFERVAAAGVDVVRVGPAYFDGSGLTEAALRGGRFAAAADLQAGIDATVTALRSVGGNRALVYLYWGAIDKAGHVHGCDSWQWAEELSAVDAGLRQLYSRLRPGTTMLITADHGMVDVPFENRLDLAHETSLAAGLRHVGGEPRALHLYCRPGAAADVMAAWRERLGGHMALISREEAVSQGWFGPVHDRVLPRIGDVIASAVSNVAVVDSRTARPEVLALLGLHGARTPAEQLVPFLVAVKE